MLVHCSFGRSRSPSVTVSYLMKFKSFTFEEALQLVKTRRPVVSLNSGFLEQLRMYELSGFNIHHAQQLLLRKRLREFQKSLEHLEDEVAFEEASFCSGQPKTPLAISKIYQPALLQVEGAKFHKGSNTGRFLQTLYRETYKLCRQKYLYGAGLTLLSLVRSVRATYFRWVAYYQCRRILNWTRELKS